MLLRKPQAEAAIIPASELDANYNPNVSGGLGPLLAQIAEARGRGITEQVFHLWAATHEVLTVDEERQILGSLCDHQINLIRTMLIQGAPFEALQKHFADAKGVPRADGTTQQVGSSTERRSSQWTKGTEDKVMNAVSKVGQAKDAADASATKRKDYYNILDEKTKEVFRSIDYSLIARAVDFAVKDARTDDGQRGAMKRLIRECDILRNRLVQANSKLVMATASKFAVRCSMDDLLNVGCHGLITAIDRYDIFMLNSNGDPMKLSTTATQWIKAKINRDVNQHAATIRIPDHLAGTNREIISIIGRLMVRHHKSDPADITDSQIAEEMLLNEKYNGYTDTQIDSEFKKLVAQVRDLRTANRHRSFDAPIDHDSETTLGDTIADTNVGVDAPAAKMDADSVRYATAEALKKLDLTHQVLAAVRFDQPEDELRQTQMAKLAEEQVARRRAANVRTLSAAKRVTKEPTRLKIEHSNTFDLYLLDPGYKTEISEA